MRLVAVMMVMAAVSIRADLPLHDVLWYDNGVSSPADADDPAHDLRKLFYYYGGGTSPTVCTPGSYESGCSCTYCTPGQYQVTSVLCVCYFDNSMSTHTREALSVVRR